jgi:hypothetical protein
MAIREHLLLGSKLYNTLVSGCGRKPELHVNENTDGKRFGPDYYTVGVGSAHVEKEFVRLLTDQPAWCCGSCVRAYRKICRDRNEKFPQPRKGAA